MSTSKHIDKICVVVAVCMLVITMLFTKGKSLGIKSVVDEDSEAFEDSAYFTNNDRLKDWDSSDATTITLKGNKAKIKGKGAYQNKDKVVIAGGGKYVLSRNLCGMGLVTCI